MSGASYIDYPNELTKAGDSPSMLRFSMPLSFCKMTARTPSWVNFVQPTTCNSSRRPRSGARVCNRLSETKDEDYKPNLSMKDKE
jgi:hypothetical protein